MRAPPIVLCAALMGCASAPAPTPPPSALRFEIVGLRAEPHTADGRASGLDLDGLDSTGEGSTCVDRAADAVSVHDAEERGIDNELGARLSALDMALGDPATCPARSDCLNAIFASRIASGALALEIAVSAIDSLADDDDVVVALTVGSATIVSAEASIDEGVLRATLGAPFVLDDFEAAGARTVIPILEGARIEAHISEESLDDLVLGVALDADALRAMACTVTSHCASPSEFETALPGDVHPRGGEPAVRRGLSAGFDLVALRLLDP